MATHLATSLLRGNDITLLITNHSNNAFVYVKNSQSLSWFKEVLFSEVKKQDTVQRTFIDKIKLACSSLFKRNRGYLNIHENEYFDYIFYHNDFISTRLYVRYLSRLNKNICCNRFEEGVLSYNNVMYKLDGIRKKRFELVGLNDIAKYEKNMYCTYPELYNGSLPTVKIPLMNPNNKEFVEAISIIFGIDRTKINYPQKYIFFSSVLDFEGGDCVGELELAKKVANLVGKENLLVKVHPRDNIERFQKEGLTVDKNSSAPWEAIQLNYDFSNHVFITVCSGSVLAINSVIPNPPRTCLLYKLAKTENNQCALNTIKYLEEFQSSLGRKIKLDFIQIAEKLDDII